ncbi:DNA binding domain protein, excisionase family [Kribbella flavida DSM 17836]|uniref:DNA binding domain protein, excisionase family n=2 Tax=Kribbella flavida TaxID=182640 RepID=D2PUJ9_KRIFD|nr:DNA binding domain protein, excisionase family [Kribbella flavida DSM 17836]
MSERDGLTEGDLFPMSIAEASITNTAPLLLTVEQAAQQLGIGRTTVFALLKSGELESIPLGRLRRIPAECITEYIDRLRAAARDNRQAA